MINDAFIAQEGWLGRERTGTVRDVVINRFDEGDEILVLPQETVQSAFARMRAADISQLPVIEEGCVVGLIEESDLLDALDRLKCALLSDRIATTDLQHVAAKLAERRDFSDDPHLDELLSHIELRAKVELAKLGVR